MIEAAMFYYLHMLTDICSPMRVFQYITFRAGGAAITAFALVLVCGPPVIAWLKHHKVQQPSRTQNVTGLEQMRGKADTPTMGGVLIVAAVLLATLLWAIPTNSLVVSTLVVLTVLAAIGMIDDMHKLAGRKKGIPGRAKIAGQLVVGLAIGSYLCYAAEPHQVLRRLYVPFLKVPLIADMGWLAVLALALVLVGTSNAVNLTDGLDGLAIGCTITVCLSYLIMAYVAGHAIFAEYLQVPHVPGSGELAVFCSSIVGAGMGFLWHNCHPAAVFMGDTGSLALGGAIGMVASLVRQELVLVIVGGVFVLEAVSVIVQVISFRTTGRRVFRCAPLHHHFQLSGWSETQVTVRFWILSLIFALLGIGTLKLR